MARGPRVNTSRPRIRWYLSTFNLLPGCALCKLYKVVSKMVPEYLYFAARLCKLYKLCKEMAPEFLYSAARLCELYKL